MSTLLSLREYRAAPSSVFRPAEQQDPVRHKPPTRVERPRKLLVACAPLQSHVNLSTIVRMAGNCGVSRLVACGPAKVKGHVARDAAQTVEVESRRSLGAALDRLSAEGYELVALEQATRSVSLHEFYFPRKTALVIGSERAGLSAEELRRVDHVVEIPVFGMPHSYNAATAAIIGMYEYCRQYPRG